MYLTNRHSSGSLQNVLIYSLVSDPVSSVMKVLIDFFAGFCSIVIMTGLFLEA